MRDIMSDASGLPLSDLSVEDKFAYKKLLYPENADKVYDWIYWMQIWL